MSPRTLAGQTARTNSRGQARWILPSSSYSRFHPSHLSRIEPFHRKEYGSIKRKCQTDLKPRRSARHGCRHRVRNSEIARPSSRGEAFFDIAIIKLLSISPKCWHFGGWAFQMWPGLLNRTRCTDLLESWCLVPWLIRCSWTLRAAPICHRSKAGGGGGRIGNRDGRGGRTTAGTANREHGWAADGTCPLGGSRLGASELGGGLAWCIAPSVRIAPNSEYI